jgi:beta-galactosidase GanA
MSVNIEKVQSGSGIKHRLLVDGEPFIVFGAQVHNSSAWPSLLPGVVAQLEALHANTLEIPVYWEQLEPSPGKFDFTCVDAIVDIARSKGLRVILLWFGTWKNGVCDYVPGWVKEAPTTYPLMRDRSGNNVRVLSPHIEASRDADARAFAALMGHLRDIDRNDTTVIMVQVQNEPGSLFTDRDYSPVAQSLFEEGVPADLAKALDVDADDWSVTFPGCGNEAFNAYAVARYVNTIAEAGRSVYDIPLSVNVWLKERKGFMRPGVEYPSGIPVSHLLDLWKFAAPAVDIIAPDIYVRDYVGYREVCQSYSREDNPLLIPETGGSLAFAGYLFYALGDFDAMGWAPFGFNRDDGMELREGLEAVRDSFRLLAPAQSEIVNLQLRGTLRVAVEQQYLANQLLAFDGFEALVEFGRPAFGYGGLAATGTRDQSGRVLVGERARGEFFVTGFDARVSFRAVDQDSDEVQFVLVEEGHFENGIWVVDRWINGDQSFFGLTLPSSGRSYRAVIKEL